MSDEPVDSAEFREALAWFASGVTVVTAAVPAGLVGFTATGFTSVSLVPPLILVCAGKRASAHGGVVSAGRFGVRILAEHQRWIAEQFARSGVDRFRDVPLRMAGVPLVDGAVALLECRRHSLHDGGDHTIIVGEGPLGVGRRGASPRALRAALRSLRRRERPAPGRVGRFPGIRCRAEELNP